MNAEVNVGTLQISVLKAGEPVQEAAVHLSELNEHGQAGAKTAVTSACFSISSETKMVIKVDLQCSNCCKKIRKILCKIPQVKDRIFDEKQNTVTITVVCCSPEKVRQKICCKGRGCILCIDIITPKPVTKDQCTQTSKPVTRDQCTQTTETCRPHEKQCRPLPVLGYLPVYVTGWAYICPPCHTRGCGWFCPCNCHCGRPPMCRDGCGRPAHEC